MHLGRYCDKIKKKRKDGRGEIIEKIYTILKIVDQDKEKELHI